MNLVAQGCYVGVAFSVPVAPGGGVVLDDIVVPVDHPDHAIGADLGHDRCRPFVIACQQIPAVTSQVITADAFDEEGGDEVAGRSVDEGRAVPIVLRVAAGGIERVSCRRGKVLVMIYLPDVRRDRVETGGLRARVETLRRPAPYRFVVAVGHRHIDTRIPVGGRAEDDTLLAEAHAPGVVVGVANELASRPIRFEPVEASGEALLFSPYFSVEARVADDSPDPIIEAPVHIARPRVGVACRPAAEENLSFIRPVIAICVAQEEGVGRLVDKEASSGEAEARRDAQLVGEDGELICPAVSICIFADPDPVFSLALGLDLVGIVRRLADPEPSPRVPGHGDRLGDVRFRREESRFEPFRHHHVFL